MRLCCCISKIRHVGDSGNNFLIKFPRQSFLDNFKMQHPQKPTSKSKSEGCGCFWFENETGVIQLQFFETVSQIFKIIIVNGEYTCKIGRASCRERVELNEVAIAVEKKKR